MIMVDETKRINLFHNSQTNANKGKKRRLCLRIACRTSVIFCVFEASKGKHKACAMGNLVGLVLNYIIFGMNSDGSPRKNKKAADNVASLLIFHCILDG